METVAFKMKLNKGCEAEYKRRHDEIWIELAELLKSTGISKYHIFLDEETCDLFGVLDIDDKTKLDELAQHPVMQRWWAFMEDIMETNKDNSPISVPLQKLFSLD